LIAADLLPPAARIAASSLPASRRSLPQTFDKPTQRKKHGHLSDDDRLLTFRFAIQAGDSYGRSGTTSKSFWKGVASSFKEATGKEYTTLAQAVDDIVKAWRLVLAEDKTGEEDAATSLTDAINKWISIVDARRERDEACKEAQGIRDAKRQESINWRNRQLMLYSDKTQLGRIA